MKKFLSILAILACLPVMEVLTDVKTVGVVLAEDWKPADFLGKEKPEDLVEIGVIVKKFLNANPEKFAEWFKTLNQDDKNQALAGAVYLCNTNFTEIALENGADANIEVQEFGENVTQEDLGVTYPSTRFIYSKGTYEENEQDAKRRFKADISSFVPMGKTSLLKMVERSPECGGIRYEKTVLSLLLEYGAEVEERDLKNTTNNLIDVDRYNIDKKIYFANVTQFAKWFKTLNQDDKNQVLAVTVYIIRPELVKVALENGADANTGMFTFEQFYFDMFPVHNHYVYTKGTYEENKKDAIRRSGEKIAFKGSKCKIPLLAYGGYDWVKLFLEHGADINAVNSCGDNAFKSASGVKDHRQLKYLLEHIPSEGLNPEIATGLITNALIDNNQELLKLYRKYGLKIDANTRAAGKALIEAADSDNPASFELMNYLLSSGADVNYQDENSTPEGMTPLINAVWRVNSTVGAITPFSKSEDKPQPDMRKVKLLLDHGANTNLAAGEGRTALYIAVINNYYEIAKLLLRYGADANAKVGFEDNRTLLQIAIKYGYTGIADLLQQHGAGSKEGK